MGDSKPESAADRPRIPGNIYLVGMMGAGKTSVGRLLARRLGKAFYDCDQEIERVTGVKVTLIFEIEGEAGFRARESRILAELVLHDEIVLSTGGGTVLSGENRALLNARGLVVYLRATPSDLWKRTRHDKSRPLLKTADPLARLQQLFDERDPLYRSTADVVVETGNQGMGGLIHKLENQLLQYQSGARCEPLRAG
jgi:shikimate kinase